MREGWGCVVSCWHFGAVTVLRWKANPGAPRKQALREGDISNTRLAALSRNDRAKASEAPEMIDSLEVLVVDEIKHVQQWPQEWQPENQDCAENPERVHHSPIP